MPCRSLSIVRRGHSSAQSAVRCQAASAFSPFIWGLPWPSSWVGWSSEKSFASARPIASPRLPTFIASRYGKSFELGTLVSIIAVVGILPYISLQLKAISTSYSILAGLSPDRHAERSSAAVLIFGDTELFRVAGHGEPLRSCLAPATSMPASAMKAWSPPSPLNPWSSSPPSSL